MATCLEYVNKVYLCILLAYHFRIKLLLKCEQDYGWKKSILWDWPWVQEALPQGLLT